MIKEVGVFSIGQIDLGVTLAADLIDKVAKLLDLLLTSPFGILASKSAILSQISGLLGAGLSLQVAVANPALYLSNLLANLAAIQAMLTTSLSSMLRDLTPQISVNVAAVAALQANLAGLLGLIDLSFLQKLALLNFLTDLRGKLASGGAALYVGKDANLPTITSEFSAKVAGGLPPGFTGLPNAYGVFIVAENPTTIEALKFLFLAPSV